MVRQERVEQEAELADHSYRDTLGHQLLSCIYQVATPPSCLFLNTEPTANRSQEVVGPFLTKWSLTHVRIAGPMLYYDFPVWITS